MYEWRKDNYLKRVRNQIVTNRKSSGNGLKIKMLDIIKEFYKQYSNSLTKLDHCLASLKNKDDAMLERIKIE